MQNVAITTQPAIEPVSVYEAKAFMRVDTTEDDDLIADLILSARGLAEEYTRRKFISTGVTITLDRFPYGSRADWWDGVRDGHVNILDGRCDSVYLPFPPVVSVTNITTYDVDNASSVFSAANYSVDTVGGRIYLNQSGIWPINLRTYNAVSIAYTAGYGTSVLSVPSAIRHAIKLTVAYMYENRECFEMPAAAKAALIPHRILNERANGM
jgi:hypothetical protein